LSHPKEIDGLLKKAEDSLTVAKDLFNKKYFDFSVSRAYYTMFYCAMALLITKNLSFSKHSTVIAFFGKEFIKTDIFPQKFNEYINDAFRKRQKSDYWIESGLTEEDCQVIILRAEEFLNEIKKYLKR
jgi:uncharacterized protein (UPF0332 family)